MAEINTTGLFRNHEVRARQLVNVWPTTYATPEQPFGWFVGAETISTVHRLNYSSDTTTASVRGSLPVAWGYASSAGNDNYSWTSQGLPVSSDVYRIDYSNDSSLASSRAKLTTSLFVSGASGNTSFGWWAGGTPAPGPSSRIQRLDYSSDLTNASIRGPLTSARYATAGVGNMNFGWFGGTTGAGISSSRIDRIDYSSDSSTASTRGNLAIAFVYGSAATGNTNFGWVGGGYTYPATAYFSTTQRIDYSSDTNTALSRGRFNRAKSETAATGSSSFGYWAGGTDTVGYSTIERLEYAADTNNALNRSTVTVSSFKNSSGVGGYPG